MNLPPCDHDECGPLACKRDGGSLRRVGRRMTWRAWVRARLGCARNGHEWSHHRNIYGDEINALGARSVWICSACGKVDYRASLHSPTHRICED